MTEVHLLDALLYSAVFESAAALTGALVGVGTAVCLPGNTAVGLVMTCPDLWAAGCVSPASISGTVALACLGEPAGCTGLGDAAAVVGVVDVGLVFIWTTGGCETSRAVPCDIALPGLTGWVAATAGFAVGVIRLFDGPVLVEAGRVAFFGSAAVSGVARASDLDRTPFEVELVGVLVLIFFEDDAAASGATVTLVFAGRLAAFVDASRANVCRQAGNLAPAMTKL
jgi:hypothetical protein